MAAPRYWLRLNKRRRLRKRGSFVISNVSFTRLCLLTVLPHYNNFLYWLPRFVRSNKIDSMQYVSWLQWSKDSSVCCQSREMETTKSTRWSKILHFNSVFVLQIIKEYLNKNLLWAQVAYIYVLYSKKWTNLNLIVTMEEGVCRKHLTCFINGICLQ